MYVFSILQYKARNKESLTDQATCMYVHITSAMQGIFGASLRDDVVMQHCQCV